MPRKHLSDLPPLGNDNLDRGTNRNSGGMGKRQAEFPKSATPNAPTRGRVGPAEESAPAYSSVVGAANNEISFWIFFLRKTIKTHYLYYSRMQD